MVGEGKMSETGRHHWTIEIEYYRNWPNRFFFYTREVVDDTYFKRTRLLIRFLWMFALTIEHSKNKATCYSKLVICSLILMFASISYGAECNYNGKLPDAKCTPGLPNWFIEQSNIKATICTVGYTKKIRPPVKRTDREKLILMEKYGVKGKPEDYELDHLISLELGGNPIDRRNLWPQPYEPKPGAREKDRVEDALNKKVCNGEITLAEAQRIIATDWFSYYKNLIGGKKK